MKWILLTLLLLSCQQEKKEVIKTQQSPTLIHSPLDQLSNNTCEAYFYYETVDSIDQTTHGMLLGSDVKISYTKQKEYINLDVLQNQSEHDSLHVTVEHHNFLFEAVRVYKYSYEYQFYKFDTHTYLYLEVDKLNRPASIRLKKTGEEITYFVRECINKAL